MRHIDANTLKNPAHISVRSLFSLFFIFTVGLVVISQLGLTKNFSQFAAILSGPPPASGKQFVLLPPNSPLPSGTECANRVRRTTWEPRPQNTTKNHYVPVKGTDFTIQPYSGGNNGIWIGDHPQRANVLLNRLDGNFTGTTDEILQWAACKWGIDEDYARAQAVVESNWDMGVVGDNGESFGILQVRTTSHATAFPGAQKSTAFNADYTYMRWRMCFEGLIDYLSQTGPYIAGDPWGCMGVWYTGNWYGSGGGGSASGAQAYINAVKGELNARKWESWSGVQITSAVTPNAPTNSPTGGIPTATRIPTVSPTTNQTGTRVNITAFLHGIGKGGDNVNPQSTGTMNPRHPQRVVQVRLYGTSGQLVQAILDGSISFNATTGNFSGTVVLGNIPTGVYTARITVPTYLTRAVPGIVTLTQGQATTVQSLSFVTGDSLVDNKLDIKDYNLLLDCFSDLTPARNCVDVGKKQATDLTDDSNVNQFDYNLFLRELSVQAGE